jgi:hypothetical protein
VIRVRRFILAHRVLYALVFGLFWAALMSVDVPWGGTVSPRAFLERMALGAVLGLLLTALDVAGRSEAKRSPSRDELSRMTR